jgi:hypothetical protein
MKKFGRFTLQENIMGSLLVLGGRYRMLKQYITLCSLSKDQKNEEIQQDIGTSGSNLNEANYYFYHG